MQWKFKRITRRFSSPQASCNPVALSLACASTTHSQVRIVQSHQLRWQMGAVPFGYPACRTSKRQLTISLIWGHAQTHLVLHAHTRENAAVQPRLIDKPAGTWRILRRSSHFDHLNSGKCHKARLCPMLQCSRTTCNRIARGCPHNRLHETIRFYI